MPVTTNIGKLSNNHPENNEMYIHSTLVREREIRFYNNMGEGTGKSN